MKAHPSIGTTTTHAANRPEFATRRERREFERRIQAARPLSSVAGAPVVPPSHAAVPDAPPPPPAASPAAPTRAGSRQTLRRGVRAATVGLAAGLLLLLASLDHTAPARSSPIAPATNGIETPTTVPGGDDATSGVTTPADLRPWVPGTDGG